jgi:PKD repeat protein
MPAGSLPKLKQRSGDTVKHLITLGLGSLAVLLLVGGCPLGDAAARYQSTIDAQVSATNTSGEAPLRVFVSGAQSTSDRGSIASYAWNFADEATADTMTAEHTFNRPGRFPITLTVVDAAGEQATARIHVRVRGGDVTAVITADRLSGPAQLGVQFDGTGSTAIDDTILDYYWDFGDTEQSRLPAPFHVFRASGTYAVELRAISAGGVEGYAEATVTVGPGAADSSLQFNGAQYANLHVTTTEALAAFTFETWCNPDDTGGTLVNFGVPNIGIEVAPGVGITVRTAGEFHDVAASIMPGQWQHVAVSYTPETGAAVYLGGAPLGTLPLTGEFNVALLSLGAGFHGKLTDVRFWSVSRDGTEIAAGMQGTLTGFEEGLLGDWPLSAGSGQTLVNNAQNGENGTRGAGESDEPADPAWSNDSP